jgi:hypothetical protein
MWREYRFSLPIAVDRKLGSERTATERFPKLTSSDESARIERLLPRIARGGAAGRRGHKARREIGYCHLEKPHNLEALPPHGFTVSCFPVDILGASVSARAGAIANE